MDDNWEHTWAEAEYMYSIRDENRHNQYTNSAGEYINYLKKQDLCDFIMLYPLVYIDNHP